MARTLLNATNSGFLTGDNIQGNSLDVIEPNEASEHVQATASAKTALNESVDLADDGNSVSEGFGGRDVRYEEKNSDHRSSHFLSNLPAQDSDAEGSKSAANGLSKVGTAINAEGTDGFQAPQKSATNMSAASTSPATGSSAAAPANAATATAAVAATGGFPDETNTGVKAGIALTKYTGTLHITTDNAVISNMEVTGDIIIDAKNVTLSNIKLISNTEWHVLRIMDDASGFTLKDSEIDGRGLSDNGVYGHGTFLRNNIHDVENGMTLWGPSSVQDNYIHNLRNGKTDPHYDGIQVNGGHDIDFIHNTIINDHDQTAALMLENTFGGLSNITVDNNQLVGGGYTVYLDGRKGGGTVDESSIKITNNQIGGGHWGDFSLYGSKPVLYGNTGLGTLPEPPVSHVPTIGDDILTGTANADTIDGLAGNDTISGLGGNDTLKGSAGADKLDGGAGADTASYLSAKTGITASLANTSINTGDAKGDTYVSIEHLTGSNYADKLYGNSGANLLTGGSGNDILNGGAGKDVLHGGAGADDLTGGTGADTFAFKALADSTVSASGRDSIFDFSGTGGDRIDLSAIDANTTASGNQAFSYLGTAAFTGKAGELRYVKGTSDTYVYGDVNGDAKADFAIHLDDAVALSKGYFVL